MATAELLNNGVTLSNGQGYKSTVSETTMPTWVTDPVAQIFANQNALLNTPYQTAPMPAVAGFTPTGVAGQDMTKAAATSFQPGLDAATGTVNTAASMPGALSAASPYFSRAARSSVSNIGAYMSPYTENVVSRIAELGGRNLSENIMPAIEGRYIGAGQLGGATRGGGLSAAPSGMLTDTARAVRDTSADITSKQYEALNSGYTGALGAANADLNRMGNVGANIASAASSEMRDRLTAGTTMGNLAAERQRLGLAGADAVTGVGNAEMAKNQQNLDAARADWMRQQGWPQEQINNAVATLRNLSPLLPTKVAEEGIVPVNPVATTSTGQDIASGATGFVGLLTKLHELGWIK